LVSNPEILQFIDSVKSVLGDSIEAVDNIHDSYVSVIVKYNAILEVARKLESEFGYVIPVACGGIDYFDENRLQVIYYIAHPETDFIVTLRTNLPREDPRTPSLTQVWDAMSFHEREAHEMFGIIFEGHSNMVPLLLPPNWRGGYPLRKDFKKEGA
jgi:NADH:ubiquinone oxidoreductase subunit C